MSLASSSAQGAGAGCSGDAKGTRLQAGVSSRGFARLIPWALIAAQSCLPPPGEAVGDLAADGVFGSARFLSITGQVTASGSCAANGAFFTKAVIFDLDERGCLVVDFIPPAARGDASPFRILPQSEI